MSIMEAVPLRPPLYAAAGPGRRRGRDAERDER